MLHQSLGYVLTAPSSKPSQRIEECVHGPQSDYILAADGTCATTGGYYRRLRSIRWVFKNQEEGTKPLYRCYAASSGFHFASNHANCDGHGQLEYTIGYVFAN